MDPKEKSQKGKDQRGKSQKIKPYLILLIRSIALYGNAVSLFIVFVVSVVRAWKCDFAVVPPPSKLDRRRLIVEELWFNLGVFQKEKFDALDIAPDAEGNGELLDSDYFLNRVEIDVLDPLPVDVDVGPEVSLLDGEARVVRIRRFAGRGRNFVRSRDSCSVHFRRDGSWCGLNEWQGRGEVLCTIAGDERAVAMNVVPLMTNGGGDGNCHGARWGVVAEGGAGR